MAEDQLGYSILVDKGLRGVVRDALAIAARDGLPGEHHFYITFSTDAEGVVLPERLRARYPKEITIVLQHQFSDLDPQDDHFSVTLSFGGRPEHLVVPYNAVRVFADPSVEFGLQFNTGESDEETDSEGGSASTGKRPAETVSLPARAAPRAATNGSEDGERRPANPEGPSAEVVTLDRFRKK